jgi:hypothetical protein
MRRIHKVIESVTQSGEVFQGLLCSMSCIVVQQSKYCAWTEGREVSA